MADQGDHKKEDSGETVYSAISGSSEASTDYFFLKSDEEYRPSRTFEDSGFEPMRQTFPITRDDPIVTIWNSSLRHKVIKLIKSNTDWCALDVIRRGYWLRWEDNPVVILITVVKNASVSEWRYFIYEIKKLCVSNNTINIHQPGPFDYQENEESTLSKLRENTSTIEDIKSRAREGLARDAELRWLPNKEADLTAEKALFSATQDFDTHLGYVFASSGFRRRQTEPIEDGCSLDWGLIKISQDRLGDNKFPEGVFPQFNRPNPPYITDTVIMDSGDEAIKWGRMTGYTMGTFNSIKSNCRLPDSNGLSTEWCFVGKARRDFADRGDSGSFVTSRSGKLGGMVIGGSEREPGGCCLAYVTPIKEVFDDIERQLGCSISLPEV
ncbi:MAG: hypothetical protein M1839_005950 [Geoglossum umbratile]|nr:MAG: hypothetical protein M1839_005950 [Geoglossum umbratile]